MNREQLEKMFDEDIKFITSQQRSDIKQFIFNTIIPEVILSVLWTQSQSFSINNWPLLKDINWDTKFFWRDAIIKKAKEQFNINL